MGAEWPSTSFVPILLCKLTSISAHPRRVTDRKRYSILLVSVKPLRVQLTHRMQNLADN
jgi:hypothetical protein